jgi:hypothetical protein
MKTKSKLLQSCTLMLLLGVFPVTNLIAADTSAGSPVYDEAAYTANMENAIAKLDKLYLQYTDKNTSVGAREKAKRGYFVQARQVLGEMNKKLDQMDPKAGAALSHTDILLMSHIQIMLIDMLAGIQESAWVAGDTSGY